ncbi:MAG: AraC family transcriptional regulator [Methylobacterium sp.]|nr:AraC family transcriptional regulator [Methylobacterium sp.]MCA3619112.1 AraC family transcriptional regulator [Methylobacterium sp.]MCA3621788.1 AraC family transcriptional regulator [Methylobacterium sp.]
MAEPDAILSDLDLEGWFFCESQLTAPWGLALPGGRLAALHAVLEGRCRIDLRGNGVARELQAGDVAFLPLDTPHALRSGPDVEAIPVADVPGLDRRDRQMVRLDHGGGGDHVTLLTASFRTTGSLAPVALSGIDPLIVIPARNHVKLGLLLELCRAEHHAQGFGQSAVLRRLGEILFLVTMQVLAQRGSSGTGWLSAINDPGLGRVLEAVHSRPGDIWSVDHLAKIAGMSRSSFARVFHDRLGMTPMRYMTMLRIDKAAARLAKTRQPISRIARQCGYSSVPSFTRAFAKARGTTPSQFRNQAQALQAD